MMASVVDMNDPQTFWLNVTNIFLGAVCVACVVMLFGGAFADLWARIRSRAHASVTALDDHTFTVADLGTTMADGGKRQHDKSKPQT